MKIDQVLDTSATDVKILRFGYFSDQRGYFTEPFRKSDLAAHGNLGSIAGQEIVQINESFSGRGVMRGLHFQWNPYMGKLVRTISGHMIDIFLDIRKGSPGFGKIGLQDMPAYNDFGEWIWVPPGFAHGNFFLEDSKIEYLCTGEYSPGCEGGISPVAADIDWTNCDKRLRSVFEEFICAGAVLSDKDRNGMSLSEWSADQRSSKFIFGDC